MATLDVKFTKFDNRPWGFRLAGGSDFPEPLTVIRVTEGSLAECMGLKAGDVIVKLNDQPISELTHGQAHEALCLAGNNFVLGVRRAEDLSKLLEGIEEKIEPYMLPIENILFDPIERETTPDEVPQIEEESVVPGKEEQTPEVEIYPEKPRDENSEKIANPNLTEEEIAELITNEEEVIDRQKGVLGVNFHKIRPRAPLFRQSKVFAEVVKEESASPAREQELKRQTTFLQRPDRPVPPPSSSQSDDQQPAAEPYRVVIKKQPPRKSVAERLVERGLLDPKRVVSPQQRPSESTTPSATPEPSAQAEADSRPESRAEVIEIVESTEAAEDTRGSSQGETTAEPQIEEPAEEEVDEEEEPTSVTIRRPSKAKSKEVEVEVTMTMDRDKIKELVTTEISLERQLESVQSQLLALKQLPSEIEKHLKVVSDQLHKIMELSGATPAANNTPQDQPNAEDQEQLEEVEACRQEEVEEEEEQQFCCRRPAESREEEQQQLQGQSDAEADESSSWAPHLISTDPDFSITERSITEMREELAADQSERSEKSELEISVKSSETDGKRVKKYIVSYESKVLQENQAAQRAQHRDVSPAPSNRSFEADPNLTLQDQLVQELKHRKGRKRSSRDTLWQPQAKQLELTYGRRWRCPNDFFNDEMIADVLSSQAEVIRGGALGVNFKKFEKTALPNYDHLMHSSVYKMIHKMEAEPKKGIPARPPKVVAAEDIIERVNTPVCGMSDHRSVRL